MTKHYEVNNEKKIIIANMKVLTEKDLKILKNYQALGFEIRAHEEEKTNKYSEAIIKLFLEEYAGEDKEKIKEIKEKYLKVYYSVAKTKDDKGNKVDSVYKKDIEDKEKSTEEKKVYKHRAGEKKLKGHVATLQWFKKKFEKTALWKNWLKDNENIIGDKEENELEEIKNRVNTEKWEAWKTEIENETKK